jgi:predicted flap endonuclease-1-like 5' DNA nuclease
VAVNEPEPVAVTEPAPVEPEPVIDAVPAPAAVLAPVAEPAPTLPASEAAAKPDNLLRIEGIGPKMARALAAAGITTYEGLAAADEATLRAAIVAAGMRSAPSLVTWPQQARLLAGGSAADLNGRRAAAE